jgi:hypothetical protein
MNFSIQTMINYSINKDDLHNLLRSVGVLQDSESLLFVNNIDLTDQKENSVVVSVLDSDDPEVPNKDLGEWTDRDIHHRFLQLAALEAAIHDQKTRLVAEFELLLKEVDRRSVEKSDFSIDDIPESVQEQLSDQIRELLAKRSQGGNSGSA